MNNLNNLTFSTCFLYRVRCSTAFVFQFDCEFIMGNDTKDKVEEVKIVEKFDAMKGMQQKIIFILKVFERGYRNSTKF